MCMLEISATFSKSTHTRICLFTVHFATGYVKTSSINPGPTLNEFKSVNFGEDFNAKVH